MFSRFRIGRSLRSEKSVDKIRTVRYYMSKAVTSSRHETPIGTKHEGRTQTADARQAENVRPREDARRRDRQLLARGGRRGLGERDLPPRGDL